MWAGVQNVSRPIVLCHEMSHITPTITHSDASSTTGRYHGTPIAPPPLAGRAGCIAASGIPETVGRHELHAPVGAGRRCDVVHVRHARALDHEGERDDRIEPLHARVSHPRALHVGHVAAREWTGSARVTEPRRRRALV